ncbi:hypothetical protein M404DRAFT_945395 [Pisolithus tinctorius Marx 270]|uniref:RNase H type-1 domain-containing protein n=1 Tax=Pisolithus tinctorius Marx 270 TaxID=870435 RepID=A0A0C3KY21_PISTI|nr:hypothetical protein M404DRAFT_945395 [Pisolithus tinctorius Marx 270]
MRTTPTNMLLIHAHIPPTPLLIQHTLHKATLCLSTLPNDHLLHPHITKITKTNVKCHCAALHRLFHNLGINPKHVEKIHLCPVPPNACLLHMMAIAPNKKEAIKDLSKISNCTLIFTDGSCMEGGVGAVAVLHVDYKHITTLHYHLGNDLQHVVFKAKAVAMVLAAHLLDTRDEITYLVTILVNNQAAIRSKQ